MKEEEMKARMTLLMSLCSSQVVLETMDNLRDTSYYKHDLKKTGNLFTKKLELHVKEELNGAFERNEALVQEVLLSIEDIIKRLATCRVDDIAVVSQVLRGLDDGTINFKEKE
jgi:hypothetical protein